MADVVGAGERADDGDEYHNRADRPRLISSDALGLTALVVAILSYLSTLPATLVGSAYRFYNSSGQSLRNVDLAISGVSAVVAGIAALLAHTALHREGLSERMRTPAGAALILGCAGVLVWLIAALAIALHHSPNGIRVFSP